MINSIVKRLKEKKFILEVNLLKDFQIYDIRSVALTSPASYPRQFCRVTHVSYPKCTAASDSPDTWQLKRAEYLMPTLHQVRVTENHPNISPSLSLSRFLSLSLVFSL